RGSHGGQHENQERGAVLQHGFVFDGTQIGGSSNGGGAIDMLGTAACPFGRAGSVGCVVSSSGGAGGCVMGSSGCGVMPLTPSTTGGSGSGGRGAGGRSSPPPPFPTRKSMYRLATISGLFARSS